MYQNIWTPYINEELVCAIEEGNTHDPYAVAVKKEGQIVGHVPRIISAACSLFLRRSGTISATVTDERQYSRDVPQGGLEVPCVLKFTGELKYIEKIKKLLPLPRRKPAVDEPALKKRKLDLSVADDDCGGLHSSNDDFWIRFGSLILTAEDRKLIIEGKELNDKHIDFAQSLIKHQFTNIEGFISTLLFSNKDCALHKPGVPIIQIVHTHGNHWIVATTNGLTNKVSIYDSMFSTIDISTKELITKKFQISSPEFDVSNAPKQKGTKDCGLFAIAICVALANHYVNHQPLTLSFDQNVMRDHLTECYVSKCMKLFPLFQY